MFVTAPWMSKSYEELAIGDHNSLRGYISKKQVRRKSTNPYVCCRERARKASVIMNYAFPTASPLALAAPYGGIPMAPPLPPLPQPRPYRRAVAQPQPQPPPPKTPVKPPAQPKMTKKQQQRANAAKARQAKLDKRANLTSVNEVD